MVILSIFLSFLLFTLTTSAPSVAELMTYVQFSSAAYCTPKSIESWSCGACTSASSSVVQAKYIQNTDLDIYGFVAQVNATTSVVSFRGTDTSKIQDWIDDLNFTMVPITSNNCNNCEVHGGFLDSWNVMAAEVTDTLKTFKTSTVIFTGHSLGGALAVLGAYFLAQDPSNFNVSHIYTIGAPRVCNDNFASSFYAPFLTVPSMARMVHNADIVPHVLIEDAGFAHSAQELWFEDDSNPTSFSACSTTNGEDSSCSDSLLFPISVSDHLVIMDVHLGDNC